ncbi:MAG: hypothetical protein ABF756_04080 [Liquorilactobacillus ghanensis]|uniref:hypothetical protein n=1 Tax=Liquorilactobacillus ghanensis TaxID=399370 RepID=UPI0039EA70F3
MNKSSFFSLTTLWYAAFAAALSFVVPIIFIELDITDIQRMGIILFGINVLYALASGLLVGFKSQPLVYLIFFPLLFLIGVHFFFASFAYYFAVVYAIFAFLACGMVRR